MGNMLQNYDFNLILANLFQEKPLASFKSGHIAFWLTINNISSIYRHKRYKVDTNLIFDKV